jgi:organic hydroperoxide reductase OsmC/OhrA
LGFRSNEDGPSRCDNGRLGIELSLSATRDLGTSPDELFAAGWSKCFLSATGIVAGKMKIILPADKAIDTELDLGVTDGAFSPGSAEIQSVGFGLQIRQGTGGYQRTMAPGRLTNESDQDM